jgi:hypothetical protein
MDNWDKEHRERGNIQLGEEILGEIGVTAGETWYGKGKKDSFLLFSLLQNVKGESYFYLQ